MRSTFMIGIMIDKPKFSFQNELPDELIVEFGWFFIHWFRMEKES